MSLRRNLALVAVVLLAVACGGGGVDRTKAQLRLVHASDAYGALDLRVDGRVRQGAVNYGSEAGYVEVDPGDAETEITRAGSSTPLLSFTPPLSRNRYATLLAFGAEGALRQLQLDDNLREPDAGRTLLRIVNAAPDAGNLDVYLTGADEPLAQSVPVRAGVDYGSDGGPITVSSATWRLRVTAAGNKADLRLDLGGIVLADRGITTLVLTPGRGGVLMNALLLEQQGGILRRDSTQARVRVAAGVADSGAVSASVGGVALMASVGSPAVGLYTLVPAGAQPVTLAVNGTPFAAPAAVTLAAGADYTLLVRGEPATPAASWIEDDNRRPADGGSAKLRLVNGLAGLAAPLSMTADFVPVADGVTAGAASGYASLTASATAQLSVTAAGLATPLFSAIEQRLDAGAVYTVFMVGRPPAAVGILRKDR